MRGQVACKGGSVGEGLDGRFYNLECFKKDDDILGNGASSEGILLRDSNEKPLCKMAGPMT